MNATINGRAAIQARIAEWQRQYRDDYSPTDFLSSNATVATDRVRWFRQS